MDGVINLLKPPGMTSHDAVAHVRRLLRERRVGHSGTLDPGAAGVLPLLLGRATRLAEYLSAAGKAYWAEVTFGLATDTLDAAGQPVAEAPADHLDEAQVRAALARFVGEIEQRPPLVSAVRVGGRRLYELAREGTAVEPPVRRVTIYRLELRQFLPGRRPVARLAVACSKGTYIRSLAADLGAALGVPAHLSYLVRTQAGPFHLAEAATLEELAAEPDRWILPPVAAVAHLPQVSLTAAEVEAVRCGRPPRRPPPAGLAGPVALLDPGGHLVAVATAGRQGLRLDKVLVP